MSFDATPSDSCVVVTSEVTKGFGPVENFGPPNRPVAFLDRRETRYYRGRVDLSADVPKRCVLMPRSINQLEWFFPDIDALCNNGAFPETSTTRGQVDPATLDDVCPVNVDDGTCEADLGLADFFCGS